MTYKLRNTVVLASIWFIVTLVCLFWWAIWQPRQIKKINKEIQSINKELEDLPGLTDEVQRLAVQYQDVKRRYDSRSKEIPQFDISSQTYGYMSRGIDEAGFLKFDMKFVGTKEEASWGYNSYSLELGEAQYKTFLNLYTFWKMADDSIKLLLLEWTTGRALTQTRKKSINGLHSVWRSMPILFGIFRSWAHR